MSRPAGVAAMLGVLALAGCGGGARSPAEQACRDRAYADPQVTELTGRSISRYEPIRAPALVQRDRLVETLVQRCLSGRSDAPRGGVEAVQPQ